MNGSLGSDDNQAGEESNSAMKTVLETLQGGTLYLEKRSVENARLNMQLMLAHVLKCSRLDLYLQFDRPLGEVELAPLRELLRRRGRREPLQHLLGEVEFAGRSFRCDARALVPRPETEELVDYLIKHPPPLPPGGVIADVGTGSGVIGLSLAAAWKEQALRFVLIDSSRSALDLARENRDRLEWPELDVDFHHGDLLEGSGGPFALIAANLPYIPTKEIADLEPEVLRDPLEALDGGPDGLALVTRLIEQSASRLTPGGLLALELGAGQTEAVREMIAGAGFRESLTGRDLSGIDRFVYATR